MAKHGMHSTKIYKSWQGMWQRCGNPKDRGYYRYGGRGISVSPRWKTFEGFYADMGPTYQEGLTIERKDVNGSYEPSNCCWIPKRDQPKNRECSIYLDSPWGRLSLQEAAAKIGISVPALFQRVKKGYDAYALYAPPAKKGAAVRPRNSPPIMVDTIWGELTLDEAAARIGVNRVTVQDRLRKGWSGDRLCAPSNQKEGLSGHGAD